MSVLIQSRDPKSIRSPEPPVLQLPVFRNRLAPTHVGLRPLYRLTNRRQDPFNSTLIRRQLFAHLRTQMKRYYVSGLVSVKGISIRPTSQACLPSSSYACLPLARVPARHREKASPWRGPTQWVAATSDLTHRRYRYPALSPERSRPPTARSPSREARGPQQALSPHPPLHAAHLAYTHGVQRSLYSLAIVSMPPARATAT